MHMPSGKSKRRPPLAEVLMALALYDTEGSDRPLNLYRPPGAGTPPVKPQGGHNSQMDGSSIWEARLR